MAGNGQAVAGEAEIPRRRRRALPAASVVVASAQFATVLIGHVDVAAHEMALVDPGHLPPLVVAGAEARFASTATGVPNGVPSRASYERVTMSVPPGASVLAYTDGLVERRGEILDTGLERLRRVATVHGASSGGLLDAVVAGLSTDPGSGDIAMLEWRWTS